jgi:hypothetical protein
MVCDVDDAVKALERVARGEKLPTQGIGEVRRQMQS